MAITNHERVGKALELLKAGLGAFVERELKAKYGSGWAFEKALQPASATSAMNRFGNLVMHDLQNV